MKNSSNSPLNPPSTSYRYVSHVPLHLLLLCLPRFKVEEFACLHNWTSSLSVEQYTDSYNIFLRTFRNFHRSSHRRCSKKSVLKKFTKFTGKRLCRNLLLIKLQMSDVWQKSVYAAALKVNVSIAWFICNKFDKLEDLGLSGYVESIGTVRITCNKLCHLKHFEPLGTFRLSGIHWFPWNILIN